MSLVRIMVDVSYLSLPFHLLHQAPFQLFQELTSVVLVEELGKEALYKRMMG